MIGDRKKRSSYEEKRVLSPKKTYRADSDGGVNDMHHDCIGNHPDICGNCPCHDDEAGKTEVQVTLKTQNGSVRKITNGMP